jgi:hypothetical protein
VMSPLVKTTVGLMGTPAYLAPEQIEGPRTVSAASDQYALGIILYQCVTGRPAFSSADEVTKLFGDILNGKRTPADELRWDLPEGFQRIIDRATSRDPAARFPSVRALGKALLQYASPKAVLTWASTFSDREAPAPVAPPASTRPGVFGRWIGTALVALGAAGTLAWGMTRAPAPLTIDTPAEIATRPTIQRTVHRIVIPPETPRQSPSGRHGRR